MTNAIQGETSELRRKWRYGWGSMEFLIPAAITLACVAGVWIVWKQGVRGLPIMLLPMIPFFTLMNALGSRPWRKRVTSLTCAKCGTDAEWKERAVGLPVEPSVLREGAKSSVVAALGSADWSAFETAKPRASIESWIRDPALFLSLGGCPRCNLARQISIEAHGMDDKGVLHLGSVLSAEIAYEAEQRLLAIARERGLMTYGHS
jgi:hypothetical protein